MRLAARMISVGLIFAISRDLSAQVRPAGAPRAVDPQSDSLTILALEKSWCDATVRGDVAVVQQLLADSYLAFTSRGQKLTKAQEIAFVRDRSDRSRTTSCVHAESEIRLYGNTAVIRAKTVTDGIWDGVPYSNRTRIGTDTWVRIAGRWQCVASHVSAIP